MRDGLEIPNTPTPGPWKLNGEFGVASNHEDMDEIVCECSGRAIDASLFSPVPGRAQANARLIAAAPEMLSLLRTLATNHHMACGFPPLSCECDECSSIRDLIGRIDGTHQTIQKNEWHMSAISEPRFLVKDHSGRGNNITQPLSQIQENWDLNYKNGEDGWEDSLGDFLMRSQVGDDYFHDGRNCSFTRIE